MSINEQDVGLEMHIEFLNTLDDLKYVACELKDKQMLIIKKPFEKKGFFILILIMIILLLYHFLTI